MKTFDQRRASVEQYIGKIKKQRRRNVAICCSICLVVAVLAAVLFVPYDTMPPDVSMYSGSEYYSLIQRLNEVTYQAPKYKNNFETLMNNLPSVGKGAASMDRVDAPNMAPAGQAPEAGDGEYVETTDNQVEGVIEADLLKRSDKYAFYLRGTDLSVYSIAGEDSQLVGTFAAGNISTQDEIDEWGEFHYYNSAQMYLSRDCKTLTILITGYGKTTGSCTTMVSLDVTDVANITEKNRVYFLGDYVSSRMVNGDILLTYNYRVGKNDLDFNKPETFVPQYGTPGDMTCIPGGSIICPETVSDTRYTVVCKVDADTLTVEGSTALLSYSQALYVSEDTIYATHSFAQNKQESMSNRYSQVTMTEITGISYAANSLEILGTISLEGNVKDQYSMDQFDGILRVVTSTTVSNFTETIYGDMASVTVGRNERNVNLYCIDLSDWTVKASVIGFAPEGEDAQSVRFDGYNAYVCTAEVITLTDPVYFFDLSDLDNITWKDTGTIEGYSTSLIQLGNGYLLGIGRGERSDILKIEVYEQTENGVISVCSYERQADYSENYKSYLVDRDHDLIGLGIYDWGNGTGREYVLLHFDGYKLNELVIVSPMDGYIANTRAFIADGWLYVFSDGAQSNFSVTKIA